MPGLVNREVAEKGRLSSPMSGTSQRRRCVRTRRIKDTFLCLRTRHLPATVNASREATMLKKNRVAASTGPQKERNKCNRPCKTYDELYELLNNIYRNGDRMRLNV